MTVNYDQLNNCLAWLKPYEHGSSHAVLESGLYRVWSYSTLMLEFDIQSSTVIYYNSRRYSMTTSRLQNLIKQNFDVQIGRVEV